MFYELVLSGPRSPAAPKTFSPWSVASFCANLQASGVKTQSKKIKHMFRKIVRGSKKVIIPAAAQCSRLVTHVNTLWPLRCLSARIGRDAEGSSRYGRRWGWTTLCRTNPLQSFRSDLSLLLPLSSLPPAPSTHHSLTLSPSSPRLTGPLFHPFHLFPLFSPLSHFSLSDLHTPSPFPTPTLTYCLLISAPTDGHRLRKDDSNSNPKFVVNLI